MFYQFQYEREIEIIRERDRDNISLLRRSYVLLSPYYVYRVVLIVVKNLDTFTTNPEQKRISEIKFQKTVTECDTKADSYLDPANCVADIDTFFIDEGLEVNLL